MLVAWLAASSRAPHQAKLPPDSSSSIFWEQMREWSIFSSRPDSGQESQNISNNSSEWHEFFKNHLVSMLHCLCDLNIMWIHVKLSCQGWLTSGIQVCWMLLPRFSASVHVVTCSRFAGLQTLQYWSIRLLHFFAGFNSFWWLFPKFTQLLSGASSPRCASTFPPQPASYLPQACGLLLKHSRHWQWEWILSALSHALLWLMPASHWSVRMKWAVT